MPGSIEVVVSNMAEALGLEKARNYGYPAFHAPDSEATNRILADYEVELILLAGYLKLYQPPPHLARAVLNIHPSLIPSFCGPGFYGMRVHRAVKARGVKVSGCTVHFANEVYDEGPIVVQQLCAGGARGHPGRYRGPGLRRRMRGLSRGDHPGLRERARLFLEQMRRRLTCEGQKETDHERGGHRPDPVPDGHPDCRAKP